jgi:hypothetical protein
MLISYVARRHGLEPEPGVPLETTDEAADCSTGCRPPEITTPMSLVSKTLTTDNPR